MTMLVLQIVAFFLGSVQVLRLRSTIGSMEPEILQTVIATTGLIVNFFILGDLVDKFAVVINPNLLRD